MDDDDDPVVEFCADEEDSRLEPLPPLVVDDVAADKLLVPAVEEPELLEVVVDRGSDGECELFVEEESLIFCLLLGDEVGDAVAPDADADDDDDGAVVPYKCEL